MFTRCANSLGHYPNHNNNNNSLYAEASPKCCFPNDGKSSDAVSFISIEISMDFKRMRTI